MINVSLFLLSERKSTSFRHFIVCTLHSLSLCEVWTWASKMQSVAFTFSPSLALHEPRGLCSFTRFRPIRFSASSSNSDESSSSSFSFHRRSWCLDSSSSSSSSSFSFKFRPWTSLPTTDVTRFEARATSLPDSADDASNNTLFNTLELGALFGLWYIFNIYFNIYNKQVFPSKLELLAVLPFITSALKMLWNCESCRCIIGLRRNASHFDAFEIQVI